MKRDIVTRLREFQDNRHENAYELKTYLLRDGKVHKAAIICPGGGYRRICSFSEGHPYAKKINQMGYHAFVLYYRVKDQARFPNPQDDLARAIREIAAHAEQWKVDLEGYSLWGSSAGGHLAGSFGTEAMGYPNYDLPRPGAVILSYPVVTLGEKAHLNSRKFQLGPDPSREEMDSHSVHLQVTKAYPPTFLWWGDHDRDVDPDNSRMMARALEKHDIPSICREYRGVDHGVGIGKGLPCEGWFEDAVRFWEKQRK